MDQAPIKRKRGRPKKVVDPVVDSFFEESPSDNTPSFEEEIKNKLAPTEPMEQKKEVSSAIKSRDDREQKAFCEALRKIEERKSGKKDESDDEDVEDKPKKEIKTEKTVPIGKPFDGFQNRIYEFKNGSKCLVTYSTCKDDPIIVKLI